MVGMYTLLLPMVTDISLAALRELHEDVRTWTADRASSGLSQDRET